MGTTVRVLDDVTIITSEMAASTENTEAMGAYNYGTELLRQNNFAEAEVYLLKAIELDDKYVDAMDHLGIVYRNLGRYEEAEKWYLRSIEINPRNFVPYNNLALVYRFQGRYEDSRQTYLKAQRMDPEDPEPYFGIGMLYQLLGQYSISVVFLQEAIARYNNTLLLCGALYNQAYNFYYMEEYEEALKYYKLALLGYPDNEDMQNKIKEIENMLYGD